MWSSSVSGQPCLAVAVADGHGDERHDRSEYGAALAVRTAIDELSTLFVHSIADSAQARLANDFKSDFPRRVGRRWREAVTDDGRRRTPELADAQREDSGLYVRYGTTLLAALLVCDTLLVGQVGDGSILLVRPDGEVECPLAGDGDDVGTVTDSLCSPDAHLRWRTAALRPGAGGLLLLATDGLTNAFADDGQWHTFARSLAGRLSNYGPGPVASTLAEWLDGYSEHASGDDVTLAVAVVRPMVGGNGTEEKNNVAGGGTAGECGDGKVPAHPEEETG
jgi:serine/threonine protein phosphatase PrpC